MSGYGVVLVPGSWAFGKWDKGKKVLFAFGPVRLVKYTGLGAWKEPTK